MSQDNRNLEHLRHSASHLLAAAVLELWPKAKPTLGPAIPDGFYYDFDFGQTKTSDADLAKIEKKMAEIVTSWKLFEKSEVSAKEAKEIFKDNPYKLELISELTINHQPLTIYKSGDFADLCRGGHSEHPSTDLKHFKLLSVAGAYWRGSEKNKMLTRIYGTAFFAKEDLDEYLAMREKVKDVDHREIGKALELFTISDAVGPGLVLWLPKGNIIKEEIENWAKETEKAWGYQRVTTPNITKGGLYVTSGHLPYYKDDMYPPMQLESGEEYFLKPMNCPHHHMIFAAKTRSYRELPLRLAEYGTCYRYEASGELFGLMRVRSFCQNDSHIYCREEEAVDEFVSVMKLHEYYYKTLGINDYHLVLSLRDPKNKKKYHGDEAMWAKAEKLMRQAVAKIDIEMKEDIGSAAFYGPKIDFVVRSSIGREFGLSTNQIDLFMGKRFGLEFTDADGQKKTPVIIHRAPLGSHERFIGFLIEHFGGAFPLWLSPVQVKILPLTDRNLEYGRKILAELSGKDLRVELDERSETLSAKIRDAQNQKIPYMLVVGDREEAVHKVAVRARDGQDLGQIALTDLIKKLEKKVSGKELDLALSQT